VARVISGRPYAVVTLQSITDRSGRGRNGGFRHQDLGAKAKTAPKAVGHNHGRSIRATIEPNEIMGRKLAGSR